MEYLVEWKIEISAASPEEAARKALAIQRNPDSIATVFAVCGENSDKFETIDLTELDDAAGSQPAVS